ncbi:MAG: HTH domain-containing protein [Desulfobacterales bacterium]|nr:HTH domain-containing protein [Desulfobacterales bacterium]
MARGDQLARQWQIIQMMLSSRMGKSAADLARELECTARTIYRDLEALQEAGFPIYTERINSKNLWSLLDTVKHQIEAEVAGTEEIKFWVMNWGSKAEVLEPESLIDEIRQEAEAMLKTYSTGVKEKEKIYRA